MKILDGRKLNQEISKDLRIQIASLKTEGVELTLAILWIGDNQASEIYIKNKMSFGYNVGVNSKLIRFDNDVEQKTILDKITELNADPEINGIILQLPIPPQLNKTELINSIDHQKDVDGLGAQNLAKLVNNDNSGLVPATARGVATLLEKNDISIAGKNVVVVGRSVLVGKSMALNLLNRDATITICHSKSQNLDAIVKNADIIIAATGLHGIINPENIRENQILVDVGISFVDDQMVGDAKLTEDERLKLQAVSPVPGGVGPMTVVSLFQNLLHAYELQSKI